MNYYPYILGIIDTLNDWNEKIKAFATGNSNNVLFGGIYDDRLLVKIVPENEQYKMPESIPYDGAKPMYLVEDIDDKEKLAEIIEATVEGLRK